MKKIIFIFFSILFIPFGFLYIVGLILREIFGYIKTIIPTIEIDDYPSKRR